MTLLHVRPIGEHDLIVSVRGKGLRVSVLQACLIFVRAFRDHMAEESTVQGRSAPDNSIERDKDSTQEQGDALLEQAKKTGKEQQQSGSK